MQHSKKRLLCIAALLASAGLVGCGTPTLTAVIKDPTPSAIRYDVKTKSRADLQIKDERPEDSRKAQSNGVIPVNLTHKEQPLDAAAFLDEQLTKELAARGIERVEDGKPLTLSLKSAQIENHRVNPFSPFVTFTYVVADLQTPNGNKRLTAYIRRGKVPVWSIHEVYDPCFSDPYSIATKELAAKINRETFKHRISDPQVDALIDKIKQNGQANADTYLDVYQLGFGNNPRAIPTLVQLTDHKQEYVRLAAISSLGILQAKDQFKFLRDLYQDQSKGRLWQDQGMALKAIGDLGSADAKTFLDEEWNRLQNDNSKSAAWAKAVIGMYR